MKLNALTASLVLAASSLFAAEDPAPVVTEECGFDRWYVGAAAQMVLPQGGSRLRHVGGGAIRFGYYLNEDWAVEAEGSWLENYGGAAVDALWHWWRFERFDPFCTLGVRGVIGKGEGQVGPKAGLGAFYHLTDSWSLRFDADATLGLETNCEMMYSLACGVQYSF